MCSKSKFTMPQEAPPAAPPPPFVSAPKNQISVSFRCSGNYGSSRRHWYRCTARRRNIRGDVIIIHVPTPTRFGFVARTRHRACLVADQGRLTSDRRRCAKTFAAVFDTNIAVGRGGLGGESGLGRGDAKFDRHGVVGGD